jgi:putative ABC transport system ATP-binding protein
MDPTGSAGLSVRLEQAEPIPLAAEFAVAAGELLALVGPSGSGKTTVLRCIAGLHRARNGHIRCGDTTWFDSENGADLAPQERSVGFVFQNYALFPHLSIFENVAYGLRVRGIDEAEIGRRVGEVLVLVGLSGYEQQFSSQLSGGEQQRVALARAFVTRPAVLFADEPTGNLDTHTGERIISLLFELNAHSNTTLVLVTHDLAVAGRCGRVLHMDSGLLK